MAPSLPFFRFSIPRRVSAGKPLPAAGGPVAGGNETSLQLPAGGTQLDGVADVGQRDRSRSRHTTARRRDDGAMHAGIRLSERTRISQQIHDDLGGVLTGLRACISVVIEHRSRSGFAPDPLLVDALALADLAFETVRKIAVNLRPAILDRMDIWSAIKGQVAQLARRTGIELDYSLDPTVSSVHLCERRGLLVFRFICEALTNVEKHAKASKVSVGLFAADGALTVVVMDNGIGMHHESLTSSGKLGISGMKERAKEFGGKVVVTSDRGIGTTVRLTVPIEPGDGA